MRDNGTGMRDAEREAMRDEISAIVLQAIATSDSAE